MCLHRCPWTSHRGQLRFSHRRHLWPPLGWKALLSCSQKRSLCVKPVVEPDLSIDAAVNTRQVTCVSLPSSFTATWLLLYPLQNLGLPSGHQQATWHTVGVSKRLLHWPLWLHALSPTISPQSFYLGLLPPSLQTAHPGACHSTRCE